MLLEYRGKRPSIGEGVFLAPTAVLIGDVRVGDGVGIFFGVVVRADHGVVRIGAGSNLQDNVVIHVPEGEETILEENVTVGHGAILEGCHIGPSAVIGMNAVVLAGARVGREVMVAAGSVVGEGARIPERTLAAGSPARVKKELEGSALQWIRRSAPTYHRFRDDYRAEGIDRLG